MSDAKEDLWGYRKRLRFVDEAIATAFADRPSDQITVLDVGCGNGSQLTIPLGRLGYRVTGVDTHAPSIIAATAAARADANLSFVCSTVEAVPHEGFDVVILSEVLEHVTDPARLLEESADRLVNNGLLIVTVPNGYGEFEWDSWLYRGLGFERLVESYERRRRSAPKVESSTENLEDRHVNFFTLSGLREMFASARLTSIKQRASTLLSGPLVGHTLARSYAFIEWNARISDRLPLSLASGWYFALVRQKEQNR